MDNTRVQFLQQQKRLLLCPCMRAVFYLFTILLAKKQTNHVQLCKIQNQNEENEAECATTVRKEREKDIYLYKTRQAENGLKILLQYDARLYQWNKNTCTQVHPQKSTRIHMYYIYRILYTISLLCYFILARSIRSHNPLLLPLAQIRIYFSPLS